MARTNSRASLPRGKRTLVFPRSPWCKKAQRRDLAKQVHQVTRRRHLPKRVRADTRDDTGHTDHWLAKVVNRATPHGTAQYSECQCVNESDLYWIQAPLQVDQSVPG